MANAEDERKTSSGGVSASFDSSNTAHSALATGLGLFTVCAIALGSIGFFFDRFWWAPDEGVYAYVAERMLHGDVLFRDIQDLHAGYVQFLHAGALGLFGADLLSLRYPLAFFTVVQAVVVFKILSRRSLLAATSAGIVASTLTFVQFLNPSANWYALFVFALLVAALGEGRPSHQQILLVGFLLGALFLVRQLTAVFVGIGTLAYLLYQLPTRKPNSPSRIGPIIVIVMIIGLAGYLLGKAHDLALLLFAAWPLAMLVCALIQLRPEDKAVVQVLGRIIAGAAIAFAPLVLYFGLHGALDEWFQNAITLAQRITRLDFMNFQGYRTMILIALNSFTNMPDASSVLNGMFWVAILALPPAVGALCLRAVWRSIREKSSLELHAIAYLAPFIALVSVHFQIPIYLMFSAAPLLWALLWFSSAPQSVMPARIACAISLALVSVGLLFQAGQPLSRGLEGIMAGTTHALSASGGLPKASVAMEADDQAIYSELLAVIKRHSEPEEPILAMPVNPEIYFLSGHRAAVPFFSTAIGLSNQEDLYRALTGLKAHPPRLIVHRTIDKYNTALGDKLLAGLAPGYTLVYKVREFDIYARKANQW
ncbi:MAG: hypothetical protein ACKVQA_24640 [Burkholderiales bacterium]